MAQAGMHALVGTLVKKVAPRREWLLLGIILGNLLPDMDNYLVAVATVAGLEKEPHRANLDFPVMLYLGHG